MKNEHTMGDLDTRFRMYKISISPLELRNLANTLENEYKSHNPKVKLDKKALVPMINLGSDDGWRIKPELMESLKNENNKT